MRLKDFLPILSGVFVEEAVAFAHLSQTYWDARMSGRAGLRKEDVEEDQVEVLVQNFYLGADGLYYHPEIDDLLREQHGKSGEVEARFEFFWSCWPRKIAKVTARKSWLKKVRTVEMANKAIDAARKQVASNRWAEPDRNPFCPHAATWLNQERWDDEMEPVKGQVDSHRIF